MNDDFKRIVDKTGEIGEVEQVFRSIAYVTGLPGVRVDEFVISEDGDLGQVITLDSTHIEVLLFTRDYVPVGLRFGRTGEILQVPVGDGILGRIVSPLGVCKDGNNFSFSEKRPIDSAPPPISQRRYIVDPFETGVALVDLAIPLAKGQRELVMGDRKIGKTPFLLHNVLAHAKRGGICVYGAIARRRSELEELSAFVKNNDISNQVVVVVSLGTDASGLVFLTPYTAMTVSEYFRDNGKDVLLILDDLTIHAKYYREIKLLLKQFPGRSFYPGDIFYRHAKLLERAGNFTKGSITCLPVAETAFGDLSGYIQTNLMSMTDGHILFDHELLNLGRRPPINPFLSITRVGHQTQSALLQSLSRELISFLVSHEKIRQLVHFGGEINKEAEKKLGIGDRIYQLFTQPNDMVIPIKLSSVLLACIWSGLWEGEKLPELGKILQVLVQKYEKDTEFKKQVGELFDQANKFFELVELASKKRNLFEITVNKPNTKQ